VVGNRFARANLTASSLVLKVDASSDFLVHWPGSWKYNARSRFRNITRIDFVLPISFADSLPKAELTEASPGKTACCSS
jgi:hypothetical protein